HVSHFCPHHFCFFSLLRPPPSSTLFPYTTLFRSRRRPPRTRSLRRGRRSGCGSRGVVGRAALVGVEGSGEDERQVARPAGARRALLDRGPRPAVGVSVGGGELGERVLPADALSQLGDHDVDLVDETAVASLVAALGLEPAIALVPFEI